MKASLYNLPKEIIIEILTKVHENYDPKNMSLEELKLLENKILIEKSSRKIKKRKEEWKKLFPELTETIEKLSYIDEDKNFAVILEFDDVIIYLYPCSKNLYFISPRYSHHYRYFLHDEPDETFPDYDIMKLILSVYK
jgi:hypothetical protein